MSTRTERALTAKGCIVGYAAALAIMLVAVLAGMGLFKNWGKRGMERDADVALYRGVGRLLAGDVTDLSSTFPKHDAGRAALEIYSFLRGDALDQPRIARAMSPLSLNESEDRAQMRKLLQDSTRAVAELEALKESRARRAGRLLLRLRATSRLSDRLGRQFRKLDQALNPPRIERRNAADKRRPPDETDNLFGGPALLLDLRIEMARAVAQQASALLRSAGRYKVVAGRAVFAKPVQEAQDYERNRARAERLANLIEFYERRMRTAVEAERRGAARRLAL